MALRWSYDIEQNGWRNPKNSHSNLCLNIRANTYRQQQHMPDKITESIQNSWSHIYKSQARFLVLKKKQDVQCCSECITELWGTAPHPISALNKLTDNSCAIGHADLFRVYCHFFNCTQFWQLAWPYTRQGRATRTRTSQFVVTGGTVGYNYDNLQCHQTWQSVQLLAGRDKMAAIFLKTFSSVFSWIKLL